MATAAAWLVCCVAVLATAQGFAVRDAAVPVGWTHSGAASADAEVVAYFAVKQDGEAWLKNFVAEVSDPDSPRYGEYQTYEQLAERVHGNAEHKRAILEALAEAGVTDVVVQNDDSFVVARMAPEDAALFFDAEFNAFTHDATGHEVVRTHQIGSARRAMLDSHCDFVAGVESFPNQRSGQYTTYTARQASSENNFGVTPQSINKLYSLENYNSSSPKNSQAVASFLGQYFVEKDLEVFQKRFDLKSNPIAKVVGVNKDSQPGIEAELDVQYITGVGHGVRTWFVSTKVLANHGQEGFLSWMLLQLNTTDSPWVHSVSYGDDEDSIDESYLFRVETEFLKFSASGRTVLVAAGDSGTGPCLHGKFRPNWPVSSPHVTAVGGTTPDGEGEETWRDGGGGFSNRYTQPEWQKEAVAAYLKSGSAPSTSKFNVSGRAYPDVSALATGFEIVVDGNLEGVAGTSCATPTFAGVVALLNDVRLLAGKPTLGFLNPLLYKMDKSGSPFQDITKGANPGACAPGFNAVKGWDPATGWGSPNFSKLKTLI